MADSQETKVLKDINRHLSNIENKDAEVSPTDTAAMNASVQDVMGNFSSLLDAQLKRTVLVTDRALSQSVGELKGFNLENANEQIGLLDDVIEELEMNNRFMAKAEHNDFLAEHERETDLSINRRTNDLLEDILESEEDQTKLTKSESKSRFFSGGMGGLTGLLGGLSIAKILGGVKTIGKKVFFPALILGAAAEFLRGWSEAGTDASTKEKFNSGIGRLMSDLTFGLVSKEWFENMLEKLEGAVSKAWGSFKGDWDAFVTGKMSGSDFMANTISGLSFGTVSPKVIKDIGTAIEEGFYDLISPMVDETIKAYNDMITLLFTDLVEGIKDAGKNLIFGDKLDNITERKKVLMANDPSLSGQEAGIKAVELENIAAKKPVLIRIAENLPGGLKNNMRQKMNREDRLAEKRRIRDAEVAAAREARGIKKGGFFAKEDAPKNLGQEAIKAAVEKEASLREAKSRTEGSGNAMQVNNSSTVHTPVDRQTENDEALNLRRSIMN